MKTITLAPGLKFPAADIATEVVASLGNRGGGKSNGAAVVAEGLLAAGVQVIVLDYVGIWFSVRLAADGKTASPFQIPVLGGRHGDIGLLPTTGAVVAEALARTGSSSVLDISMFSKGDRCRFATDFAEAFFRAKKDHPGPVQILLEEAQRYVPQKLFTGQERMLGAFEEIAEVGRNYGIGLHLISQRPQKINKDVLNLADTVFGYRTNGVLERKAISEWVQEKGAEGRADVHDELPGLERGSAIVWCPSRKIFGRYAISKKTTYDAGATPMKARAAVRTKPLDLNSLESAMAATIEEAKMNDPKALRAKIAELERAAKMTPVPKLAKPEKAAKPPREVSVFREADLKRIEKLAEKLGDREQSFKELVATAIDRVAQAQQAVVSEIGNLVTLGTRATAKKAVTGSPPPIVAPRALAALVRSAPALRAPRKVSAPAPDGAVGELGRCPRALLSVLVQRGQATASQVSALSGYRKTSSSFANGLGELRTKGLITGSNALLKVTAAGVEAIGPVDPLPEGPALLDYWLRKLGRCEAVLLKAVYEAGTISREDLSERSGYSITSSSFANGVGGLRTLDLVSGGTRGEPIQIAEVFGA